MGSSRLVEYVLALIVAGLALLGALLCLGFLLWEPLMFPPSSEEPLVDLGKMHAQLCRWVKCFYTLALHIVTVLTHKSE